MASAFWGGFADTVLSDINKKSASKQALEDYKAKKNIDLSFETTEVEDVDSAGNPVLRKIGSDGSIKSERKLTQTEVEVRHNAKRKLLAEISGAEARADVDTKQARDYDADRQAALDDKAMGRKLQQGQLDYQYASLDSLKADRADRSADRKLALEDRLEAKADKKDANSAHVFAATQMNKLTEKVANLPIVDKGTSQSKTLIVERTGRAIKSILDSDKSEAEKKRIIQRLIDSVSVHVPAYSRTAPPEGSSGL